MNCLLTNAMLFWDKKISDQITQSTKDGASAYAAANPSAMTAVRASEGIVSDPEAGRENGTVINVEGSMSIADRIGVTAAGRVLVLLLLAAVMAFLFAGTFTDCIAFKVQGMVGYVLGDNADKPYSFVSLGLALPRAVLLSSDPGQRWVEMSYFW